MLRRLYIRNFTLIDELDMEFRSGFSVITGETGAGKSIILGAIGLLLGQRADMKAIKQGADRCVVEAHFDLNRYDDMERFFEENGLDADLEDTIIRRELTASGKSRAFVNDVPVPLGLLKELGERLIDVHSQHQNLLLGKHDFQLSVVDTIARDGQELAAYREVYDAWRRASRLLDELKEQLAQNRQAQDFMQFQFDELTAAKLADGEQEELEARSETMEHAEDIKQALCEADHALSGEGSGIVSQLRSAVQALRGIERVFGGAAELAERLDSSYIELKDVAQEVSAKVENIDFDPAELDAVNARLDRLYDLEKKYRVQSVGELIAIRDDLAARLGAIEGGDELLKERELEVERLKTQCLQLGRQLSQKRSQGAAETEEQTARRLTALGMPHARFQVEVSAGEPTATGLDRVAFLFSANTSSPLQPVSQVASGGEIARVMLALKAMVSGAVKLPTIIFDEIDTGVSGKIAEQMAQIMAEMGAQDRQVISITHLPQIAALGATHYKVYKEETPQGTASHMALLTADERIGEIAQMLSGSSVTEAAIQNAKQLLKVLLFFCLFTLLPLSAQAQPWVKKAARSVFALKTFDAQGTLLASGNGVFVGQAGEALSSFAPFKGASSAVVIDAQGKQYPVEVLLGANDTYDVVKFRVGGLKKSQPLPLATTAPAVGSTVSLLPYREAKTAVSGLLRKAETFGSGYDYYTVRMQMPQDGVGLPLLDADGQLLGLMQQPATAADTLCYAVSARFADSLKMTGLSINDPALRATHIKKALPAELSQAQLTLFVAASTLDSAAYAQLLDDFIRQFPDAQDGYISRAQFAAGADRYAQADRDMTEALRVSQAKDEVHYSYSRLIYQKALYRPEPPYEPWTLDRALQEAEAAYDANPQPAYRQQQAYVLYAQQKFAEAGSVYETIFNSALRSPDLFFEAARCKLAQSDTVGYLALLDSAVSLFSRPLLKEAAPYLLARAQARLDAGKYRDATNDLNDYEQLMAAQVNDQFYYLRFQAEQGGRLFQQALNDIAKAIQLNPRQEVYYAEKASLEVRVGLYDDAILTARECISLVPDYSDGHLFLGLAQCLKGNKTEGVKSLQRAKELGDEQADGLIEKYGK
ncbi:MAG: DNA repair protein RecN [Prevotella sp.]|nr:DNA repair protein RecN [Prevotella sp.]